MQQRSGGILEREAKGKKSTLAQQPQPQWGGGVVAVVAAADAEIAAQAMVKIKMLG